MTTIRQATEKDIPRIMELYEEFTEEKLTVSSEVAKRVFSDIVAMPNQEFLVAEKDGPVIGTLFF